MPDREISVDQFATVVKPWFLERGIDLDDEEWNQYLDVLDAYQHCSDED